MHQIDIAILVIITISTLMSFFKGLISEIFSLIIWAVAFIISKNYYPIVSDYLIGIDQLSFLQNQEDILNIISMALVFMGVLIIGSIFNTLLRRILKTVYINKADKILGMIFGALRGLIIVIALIAVAENFTSIHEKDFWQDSIFIHQLEPLKPILTEIKNKSLNSINA